MNVFNIRTIRGTYTVFCVVCVLCMVIFWVCKYRVDRDIGVVDYVLLEEAWDIKLPAVSLCFHNPFIDKKLIEFDPEVTHSSYIQFLKGNGYNEKYNGIDYSNVTLSLETYFLSSTVVLRNLTPLYDVPFQHRESFNGFIMGLFIKCFEITINITDYHNVLFIALTYDKTKLLLDFKTESEYNLSMIMHHPGQFLLNSIKHLEHIDMKTNMGITISDLELLKSRNSRNRRCTEYDDETSFDDMVREKHLLNIGCTPPYLKSNEYYPPCNSTTGIKHAFYDYKGVGKKYYPNSCLRYSKIIYQQYEKILIEYLAYTKKWAEADDTVREKEGMENGMKHNDEKDLKMEQLKEGSRKEKQTVQKWAFGIEYPQYVRIISQSKDVDIHALIGNIGGYVGLFLGNMCVCNVNKEFISEISYVMLRLKVI